MHKVNSNFYFFYFLNVLKLLFLVKNWIIKKKNIESMKTSASAEIIKSIKINQHLYGQ